MAAGDDIARLYDRYADGMFRYAVMVLADRALAEDAVQQVFAKLVALGSVERLDAPDRYLRRAVRNECYALLERRSRTSGSDQILEAVDAGTDHAERLAIEAALRELPPEQREVLTLKIYEGMTFKEIAEIVQAPLDTVASRYRYAIDKLRRVFAP